MEPITTLTGYLLSRFLHGIRIILLTATPCLFLSHSAIAYNIRNKAPSTEDGRGENLRSMQAMMDESHCMTPDHSLTLAFASGIKADDKTSNLSNLQQNYEQKTPTSVNEIAAVSLTTSQSKPQTGDEIELASAKLQSYNILLTVQQQTRASDSEMNIFYNYYYDKIYANDRSAFWRAVENKQIVTDADIKNYAQQKITEYITLFNEFRTIEKNYPNTVTEYSHPASHAATGICNPACDNIGFENGNLSAWDAYYAQNTSTSTAFNTSTPSGGACGAVTRSAYDPNIPDYQVRLMSGTGVDPVAGSLIPIVCPTGGSYSCRIGDSTRNGAQVAMIDQTFTVTSANANFTYMYAVVLENPGHTYYQQPYFNVKILDQYGNPITGCGNYSVVSGPGLPGYTPIFYAPDFDTVYCKPWTTVFVPLQSYIGQCITLQVTVSDCSLGGHFGYAYFDATCSPGIISSSPAICGKNITLTAPSGAATYQWIGPCIVGSTTQQTATVSCAGIYKVAVTSIAGSGCSDTIVDTVKGSTPPVVSIISHNNVLCNGGTNGKAVASTTGGTLPYSYSWTGGAGSSASASNLASGVYTVTVTDAAGCSDTASVRITEPGALTVTQSSLDVSCNGGNNGMILIVPAGGTKPYSYTWLPAVSTGGYANNLVAGIYTITITDSNYCSITTTSTVGQPAKLTLSIASLTDVACFGGNNGNASVNATGGTGSYTYTWTPSVSVSNSASNLTAGTYNVTVTDANSCTASTTLLIMQPPVITSRVLATTNISCSGGNNGTILISATGGTPTYTYVWTPSVSIGVSANNLTAGTYMVTITDANGCTSQVSTSLLQPQPVMTTLSSKNPTCYGLQNGDATVTTSGGTPSYTYVWGTTPNQYTATANNIGAGTYTVLVSDANGCTKTDTVVITQPAILTSAITGITNPTCYNDSNGTASAYVTGGTTPYSYVWSTIPKQTVYKANKLSAGTYTVNAFDANNCPVSSTVTITQPSPVTTTVIGPDSICSGTTVTITASGNGGNGIYSYNWSMTSGTIATQNVTPLLPTTYTVTAVDGNGCLGNPATVTVNTWNLSLSDISVTPPQSVCYGDSVTLYANVTNSNSGTVNIQWSNGFNGSGPFRLLLANDTSFTITVTNQCGATAKKTIVVRVNPLPVINIPVQTAASCYGVAFTYNDASAANVGDTYAWNFGDGTTGNTNPITHSYNQSGLYTVTVVITTPAGCKSSSTAPANVTIYPTAKAIFTADPSDQPITNPVITFDDKSLNTSTWSWDFGDNTTALYTSHQNPVHRYSDTGTYDVHLYTNNTYGCADSAKAKVHIDPEFEFYVPNAFSPNGDGLNETFTGKGIGILNFDMVIYDRWGMFLFETTDLYKGWDGTVNGGTKVAQEDTYVYMIKVTDIFEKVHNYMGSVTIIK